MSEILPRRNAPIITAELGNLCSDLERFKLPAVVGDLTIDVFAFWNTSFCGRMSLTPEELAQVKIDDLEKVTTLLDAVIDAIVHGFERTP